MALVRATSTANLLRGAEAHTTLATALGERLRVPHGDVLYISDMSPTRSNSSTMSSPSRVLSTPGVSTPDPSALVHSRTAIRTLSRLDARDARLFVAEATESLQSPGIVAMSNETRDCSSSAKAVRRMRAAQPDMAGVSVTLFQDAPTRFQRRGRTFTASNPADHAPRVLAERDTNAPVAPRPAECAHTHITAGGQHAKPQPPAGRPQRPLMRSHSMPEQRLSVAATSEAAVRTPPKSPRGSPPRGAHSDTHGGEVAHAGSRVPEAASSAAVGSKVIRQGDLLRRFASVRGERAAAVRAAIGTDFTVKAAAAGLQPLPSDSSDAGPFSELDHGVELVFASAREGDFAPAIAAIETGKMSINCKDVIGDSLLMVAVQYGGKKFIQFALGRARALPGSPRLELNAVDMLGNSALHYACLCGDKATLRALTDLGADTSIRNHQGKCCYDYMMA